MSASEEKKGKAVVMARVPVWPVWVLISQWIPGVLLAGPVSQAKTAAHVKVQAYADRSAVVPGGPLTLAVSLEPEKDWHVYWRSPGGLTGLPTQVAWKGPSGFGFGRAQFPVPRLKHDETLKEDSYVLDGRSIVLVPVTVPASIPAGGTATFEATVSWLACKKECIPGEVVASVNLPIALSGAKADPANEAIFREARADLPEPVRKAEHVKIAASVDAREVKRGDKFGATLAVEIEPKSHMQSRTPLEEGLIPAVLFLESTPGLEIGEVAYPKAQVRQDKMLGKLSEYGGRVEFKIPVVAEEDAPGSARAVRGVLQYQICTDAGTCYPPQWIEIEIPVPMAGGVDSDPPVSRATADPAQGQDEQNKSGSAAVTGDAAAPAARSDDSWLAQVQTWFIEKGFWGVLVLAAMGGLVLNLMPCVLPVISLKVLSFVRQAGESRGRIFVLGAAYCVGIMTFFGLLAALFASTGQGWGEHFQEPVVVLVLAGVVTAFALSLFGVFSVFTPHVVNKLGQAAEAREGPGSAFFTGVLATVLGTACTAPFLSAAVGIASKLPPHQGPWVFVAVGAGMALPFFILAVNPAWLRFVPRPGPWMGTFEALMGFLLLGTVIWLLNPIRGQLGDWGLLLTLIFLLGVAMAAWVKGRVQWEHPTGRKAALSAAALVLLALAWLVPFQWLSTLSELEAARLREARLMAQAEQARLTGGNVAGEVSWNLAAWEEAPDEIPWVPYDEALVRRFVETGYTVFVDFTADWCASCKTNLKTAIDVDEVKAVMRELSVVPFEADYTSRDPELKRVLAGYGRAGVPLYLVFAPREPDSPQILSEFLVPGTVIDALRKAGASKARAGALASATQDATAPTKRPIGNAD